MDLTNTSRYLSLILRHKPEVIGVTLDEHGWSYGERGVCILLLCEWCVADKRGAGSVFEKTKSGYLLTKIYLHNNASFVIIFTGI